jgi:hypothetical protein
MAKFKPGNPGRPKGAANRETREIRAAIQEMVNYIGEPARLRRILDRVAETNPAALVNFMARVAPKELVPAMGSAQDTQLGRWLKAMGG